MTPDSEAQGPAGPEADGGVRIPALTPAGFFDAAGGLPPTAETVRWLTVALETAWADPAGRHAPAARTRAVLEQASTQFSDLLGCAAHEIWFAPNVETGLITALRAVSAASPAGLPVLSSPIERLALLQVLDDLPHHYLAVDAQGRVDASSPELGRPAAAVLVQAANREIGTSQPLRAIAASRSGAAPLVVDASAVRSPEELPSHWDVLVLEPVVWGGPEGIAVVACRANVPWRAAAPATGSQRFPGRVSAALAAAAALSLPGRSQSAENARIRALVERLAQRLADRIPHLVRLGDPAHRLGYLLAVSMLYVNAEQLVDDLAAAGFAVHSGSACAAETRRPSHVLTAIGALTGGNLRISLPPGCPSAQVDALADAIAALVAAQRAEAGVS